MLQKLVYHRVTEQRYSTPILSIAVYLCDSVMVKALCYNPGGRGFDTR
jgi:hypothetical protein